MSIKQYTAKKLLANIITINKKLLDMTLGLAEAFKGNTVGFIIGEVDSDVTELTNRVKQPVCVVEVTDAVAELRAQVERLTAERDALQARIDAGVRVYGYQGSWYNTKWTADTDTALLIDRQPAEQRDPSGANDRRMNK